LNGTDYEKVVNTNHIKLKICKTHVTRRL